MIEPLQIVYYAIGILGIAGGGIAWIWKHFDNRHMAHDKRHEAMMKEFHEFRVHASEKFATVEGMTRVEAKIDQMSDRITRTLLSLFSGKNLKGTD